MNRSEFIAMAKDVHEHPEHLADYRKIPEEKLKRLLDKDFANDVSFKGYTDETLLNEVDGMTDLLYERQGGYLEAKEDDAKSMLAEGLAIDMISRVTKLSENRIRKLQAELAHETAHT